MPHGGQIESLWERHYGRWDAELSVEPSVGLKELLHLHLHLSLNRGGRWGTTYDLTTSFLHLSLFSTALWNLALCIPFPDVVFLPLFLSALSSFLFRCALQDGFGQT